ncbi:hypothetical protein TCAL_09101 [Tigriopus californicus]|uniref:Splicing factor 3A subunit 1 n=1 Tax=Tigriopus californicus TaxID=6832 RepID=A0A553N856_TIGCA|nr:splicing factor 3A subunit 1-like [Tigriopus californicus]TRY61622.1 hypothetical protein TCAL_09101 [Tigriopus californicus]
MPPVPLEEGAAPSVGIIYPPPEVRNIVDKTASFVARNGPEFELRIRQNEVNNPKFNFLNSGDPYHAYYQHRVKEIREGKDDPPPQEKPAKSSTTTASSEAVKQKQSELLKQAQKEQEPPPPKDPPPEFEFIADPPSISAFDLDVVKLTAQFVARNGRQFLTNLMNREQRNFQFDFLRPQHSLFQYFTKLLEQYTKVLIPPKDLMKKLESESKDENLIRDQIDYRVRWVKHQEAKKQKEEAEAERERVSYAQVDWHGFVVVETVDYQPWEVGNFPPPTNPTDVGARVLMQRRIDSDPQSAKIKPQGESANTQVEDMDEDSSEESSSEDDEEESDSKTDKGQPKPPALPTPGNVEVRKYDPKAAKSAKKVDPTSQEFLISPITGERIPADQVQEHMRIGLLDPRWVEERDKQITARAAEEQVYAPGRAIESNLKQLAERRTDIFGVGEDAALEAAIGKKMGEEEKREEKVTWDGHSSSAESTSRAARATISISEQIEQIHRSKGLLPKEGEGGIGPTASGPKPVESAPPPPPPPMRMSAPPVQAVPMSVPMMPRPVAAPPVQAVMMAPNPGPPAFFMAAAPPVQPAPPPFQMAPEMMMGGGGVPRPDIAPPPPVMPPMEPDEPPNKRPRGEDNLIPEGEFMARNPNPVTFHILCPIINDKPEWRLTGQSIALTLGLGETVTAMKGRIHDETGLPPGKQKLQLDSIFLKDGNTLAYYNVRPGMAVGLQIKERGGRKK